MYGFITGNDSCQIDNDTVTLLYGSRKCSIQILSIDDRKICLRFSVEGLRDVDRAFVHLPLYHLKGTNITVDGVKSTFGEEYIVSWIEANTKIRIHDVECDVGVGSTLRYPVFPFNSYQQKQERNFNEVYGIWSIELDYLQPSVDMTLQISNLK